MIRAVVMTDNRKPCPGCEVFKVDKLMNSDDVMSELKCRGRKSAHILSLLQVDWPVSEDIIRKLSSHISRNIIVNNEPVIYFIVEKALAEYSHFVFFKGSKKYQDIARISVFLETLITETCKILEVQVVSDNGDVWSVNKKESFNTWLSNHDESLKVIPHLYGNTEALRSFIYELIANESVKKILRSANYEQTVVTGSMDYSN